MADIATLLASFASAFTQHTRQLTLQLGDNLQQQLGLLPLSLSTSEALSQPYHYQLECLAPDDTIPLASLVGLPATLSLQQQDGSTLLRGGVVTRARTLGADGGFARYALEIEPPFALLQHRRTSRVFQDLSVDAIVRHILDEHAAANPVMAAHHRTSFALAAPLPTRSYCLQYRETDLDFIVRLLHEEGLAWRFEHAHDSRYLSTLVAFDDPYSLPAAAIERVRFHRADATEAEDGLTAWHSQRQLVTDNVQLASYDYQPVATAHSGDHSAIAQGSGQAAQASLTDYDAPGPYYASSHDQLAHYARLRQQAYDRHAKTFHGSGVVRGLHPGHWFRLDDHPAHASDNAEQREFVVTRQQLTARNNLPDELAHQLPASLRPTPDSPAFHTTFDAQRRGIPLTPDYAHTPHAKPTAPGAQTATVVGPAGEEVHTDTLGRIKIQFHWQRPDEHPDTGARLDDTSSCWLRVALPSAGAGWGHQFLPRIGQEVLVHFLEGDIDRPLVSGVLYNGSHPPPQFSGAGSLPANKTLSGIQSREHQGSQYSELLFDDTPGQVRAKLSSEPGKTQLNQGYLTHPRSNGQASARGNGFELRTDHHGAIRAGHGLLLSTEAQQRRQRQTARPRRRPKPARQRPRPGAKPGRHRQRPARRPAGNRPRGHPSRQQQRRQKNRRPPATPRRRPARLGSRQQHRRKRPHRQSASRPTAAAHPQRPGRVGRSHRQLLNVGRRQQYRQRRPARHQPDQRPPLAAQRRPAHQPVCGGGKRQSQPEADCGEGQGADPGAKRRDGTDGG